MRHLIVLTSLTILALTSSAGAATLNKCIDATGQVTYSNLPCRNARETRTLEIDPAPSPDPVRSQPALAQPAKPVTSSKEPAAAIQLETRRTPMGMNSTDKPVTRASARQCDTLTDKLGRVFDKMDQARRKGYTQAQMDKWDQEVKDLERQKQHAGCF